MQTIRGFTARLLNGFVEEARTIGVFLSHQPPWFLAKPFIRERFRRAFNITNLNQLEKSNEVTSALESRGLTLSHDWFTMHVPVLVEIMKELPQKRPARILEIGSFEGLSTVGFSLLVPEGQITAVDTWEGSPENLDPNSPYYSKFSDVEKAFDANTRTIRHLTKHRKSSLEFFSEHYLGQVPDDALFDLAYIDGSHDAADVLMDGLLAFRVLKPGGILIFDDYAWNPQPKPAGVRHPADGINPLLRFLGQRQVRVVSVGYQLAIVKKPAP